MHTLGRYFAILIIVMLGSGFFSGLSVTKKAMLITADDYVNSYANMYDFRILTTIGFDAEDEDFYRTLDGIGGVKGIYSTDFLAEADGGASSIASIKLDGREMVLKAISISPDINKPRLLEGRMPQAPNECIADASEFNSDALGAVIKVKDSDKQNDNLILKYDEYVIVGLGCSPSYLNRDRGTTALEGGSLSGFILIPEDGFDSEHYTEMLLTIDERAEIFSDEYADGVSEVRAALDDAAKEHTEQRYESIKDDAYAKLSDAKAEYNSGLEEYERQRAEAEAELADSLDELNSAKAELDAAEAELDEAKRQIEDGRKQYSEGLKAYDAGVSELDKQKASAYSELEQAQNEINTNRASVDAALAAAEATDAFKNYQAMLNRISELEALLAEIEDHESAEYIGANAELSYLREQLDALMSSGALDGYLELIAARDKLDAAQKELDEKRGLAENEFQNAQAELDQIKARLDSTRSQLDAAQSAYNDGLAQFNDSKRLYEEGMAKYESAKAEADAKFAEAEAELDEASAEIESAEEQYDDLASIDVMSFVFERGDNSSYVEYENDSNIVEGLSKVLPVFFFLVAALVCTTTMIRMVDEQRTQIGTLKALGYSNGSITYKFVSYSGSAALIGCVLGYFIGSCLFPYSIWQAYKILYNFGEIELVFDFGYLAISLAVSLVCTVGSTLLACYSELSRMPAQLMRPKAPDPGKRVLVERIGFVWKHLSFFAKVSIRNIFRYKRRLIMMLLGVGGCTALVLTCFGVRDSISNIADDQFNEIMKYDCLISFTDDKSDAQMSEFKQGTDQMFDECVFVITDTVEADVGNMKKQVNVIAADDPNIKNVMGLSYNGENVDFPTGNAVIISDKLARSAGIKPGETLKVDLSETESVDLTVEGIFKNYVYDYILMSEGAYSEMLGREVKHNTALTVCSEDTDVYDASSKLLSGYDASAVIISDDIERSVKDMMSSLNYIIGLVIGCACALALVVSYNLGNISITERIREIATLKVLGLRRFETSNYVFRENLALTVAGSLIGLPFGVILHRFVMSQITIEMVSFNVRIIPLSFFLAFAISIAMTLLVDIILQHKIDGISMADSLKSVE